jgi:hypothetical protein
MAGKKKQAKNRAVSAQGTLGNVEYVERATPGQEHVPPVMIVVCDNTDIAELVYQKISGETQVELVTQADIEDEDDEEAPVKGKRKSKPKWITSYGPSAIRPELANTEDRKHTIRIDTKLLAEAESGDPRKGKKDFAEELRQVVATVGKPGQPGEHVRCVVSVGMLTEGWDANNVSRLLVFASYAKADAICFPILIVDTDQGFCCIIYLAGKAEVSHAGEHLAKE